MKQNFDLERELAERSDKDWQFGAASQPGIVTIPLTERLQWLPKGETQFGQFEDYQDCASRSPVNHLEALFTYHYHHDMLPANKRWLEAKGYIQEDRVTFSDRYIALLSGTTRNGNSLKAPLETIRKFGLIPKSLLPKEEWMKWEDYYDPTKITMQLKTLGEDFLARFTINYEQVALPHFADALKDDMLGVAAYAWPTPKNGVYPRTDGLFNHAFILYQPKYEAYDNYLDWNVENTKQVDGDFTKTLAPDYAFFDYGYRVYISAEIDVTLKINLMQKLVEALKRLIGLLTAQTAPTPTSTPKPAVEPNKPPPEPSKRDHSYAGGGLDHRARMYYLAASTCDEEGLSYSMKQDLLRTIAGESGFNADCINFHSRDYGLCQFSERYYLKEYNMTPEYALSHPEECVRIMAKNFKLGRQSNWVAYATRNKKQNVDMVAKLKAHYKTLSVSTPIAT